MHKIPLKQKYFVYLNKNWDMNTIELQESIIQLSDFERTLIKESKADYLSGNTISNEDVFNRNEKWL